MTWTYGIGPSEAMAFDDVASVSGSMTDTPTCAADSRGLAKKEALKVNRRMGVEVVGLGSSASGTLT
jgi:hypothetical protein